MNALSHLDPNAARAGLEGTDPLPAVGWNDRGPLYPWTQVADRLAAELDRLLTEVERELDDRRGPGRVRHASWQRFEAEAAIVVHRALPRSHEALADEAYWLWLACTPLRSIVERRYGREEGAPVAEANFGLGNFGENFAYRLRLRADCVVDEAATSEEARCALVRRGQSDFWRSHVFRQRYGGARAFVRAFVRSIHPDAANPREPALPIEVVRVLAKRLRRLFPNLLVDLLSEADAFVQIEQEAVKARARPDVERTAPAQAEEPQRVERGKRAATPSPRPPRASR